MGWESVKGIYGYYIGSELVCKGCLKEDDTWGVERSDFVTWKDLENKDEDIFFCDRCEKKIEAK